MHRIYLLILLACLLTIGASDTFAQVWSQLSSPLAGTQMVLVDTLWAPSTSYGHRMEDLGFQDCIFYEPLSGNLVITWYDFYSGQANPRRIAAATSADMGDTWSVFRNINFGLPNTSEMSAYYPTAWGLSSTPIILYRNYANDDPNISNQPTVAVDYSGWGGGAWGSTYVDNKSDPDTNIAYYDYDFVTAPDNPSLWIVGGRGSSPGENHVIWRSIDGGFTFSRPKILFSNTDADSLEPYYMGNLENDGFLLDAGLGGKVYAASTGDGYLWFGLISFYRTSDDYGVTWSDVQLTPAPLAGLETSQSRTDNFTTSVVDLQGNWHLFQVVADTSDEGDTWERWLVDTIYDGSTWSMVEIARPQLMPDGFTWSTQTRWLFDPAIDASGTIYYTYTDVADTTGDGVYKTYVKYSEDNGQTWMGPVEILDGWMDGGFGQGGAGVARVASDYLHIAGNGITQDPASVNYEHDILGYIKVPTAEIKAAVSVSEPSPYNMVESYKLHQNFPNPFNPATSITFDLKEQTHVTLKIYNELGQEITTLIDKTMTAGHKGVSWNARTYPSGVYFYKLTAGDFTETRKMVLSK